MPPIWKRKWSIKNCYIEVFEDDNFDPDDPHVVLQGPKEYATLKNLAGKDWSNDIESVIVGSNATVRAYEDKDFKGTELAFVPGQEWPTWGSWTWRTTLNRSKYPAANNRFRLTERNTSQCQRACHGSGRLVVVQPIVEIDML